MVELWKRMKQCLEKIKMGQKHQYFDKAVEFLKSRKTISCAELQIEFKLGYNSAGMLVDELEHLGIISGFEGSRTRTVLINESK